jgi:two-component system response regulator FlrC
MESVNVEYFGKDLKVIRSLEMARNLSATKAPMLVSGEAGLGKRALCQYVHTLSRRKDNPLLVVDCALEPKIVENQILGYRDEEGKFHKGVLEQASKGTVVFANIEGLEEAFQKRVFQILTELEDYDFDIRLMATSTKNLSKLVGAGRFHRSLYTIFSNNQIVFRPLRERPEDIANIVTSYLGYHAPDVALTKAASDKLTSHYWTHNVKELLAVLSATVDNIGEQMEVDVDDLTIGEKKITNSFSEEQSDEIKLMSLRDAEMLLIKKALIHTSENRTQAAKILGVSIRTLRNKINEYRLEGSSYFVNLR